MSFLYVAHNLLKIQNQLLKFAYSLTSNQDDAKDLLQDTILKTLENHEKFIEDTNFKSWAFTIMRNLFINGYRKDLVYSSSQQNIDDIANCVISQDRTDYLYDYKFINKVISNLDNDKHKIIFGLYLSKYKYEEIAKELNLPLGTIKREIHTIKLDLQKKLQELKPDGIENKLK